MRARAFIMVALVLCCFLLWGQVKKADIKSKTEQSEEETAMETQVPPGEYFYKPEGRRDPFLNLLNLSKGKRPHEIEGIGGLMIDELELEGIIKAYNNYRAMLKGPDNKPYVVTIGDKVYDGEVVAIDGNSISFKKISTIMISGQKEKIIVKTLNPEKEED